MALSYLGNQSLAAIIPGLSTAVASLQAAAMSLTDMKADKDSELSQVTTRVEALNSVLSDAQDLITGAQTLLSAATDVLNDSDALLGNLAGALAASGIHLFAYAGTAGNLGTEVSDELVSGVPGGDGEDEVITGLVLVTSDGGAWSAISSVLKTS